jgi:exopolysaccharide biosynthesis polyprenyl glycosylphosphotransferase
LATFDTIRTPKRHLVAVGAPAAVTEPAPSKAVTGDAHRPRLRNRLVCGDALAAGTAWALSGIAGGTGDIPFALLIALVVLTSIAKAGLLGLYTGRVSSARSMELSRVGKVAFGSSLPLVIIAVVSAHRIPVLTVALGIVLTFALLVVTRSAADAWLRSQRQRGRFCRDEIIIGTGEEARRIAHVLFDHPELGRRVVGMIGNQPLSDTTIPAIPWLGPLQDAVEIVRRSGASGAFIASEDVDAATKSTLLEALHGFGIHVHVSSGLFGIASSQVKAAPIMHEPMLYIQPAARNQLDLVLKRSIDIVVSSIFIVVSAPILALAALAVRLSSPGRVVFRQDRVGRDGSIFKVLKLRTMVVDAEARLDTLRNDNQRNGPLFKAASDPRVTVVGKILRASSIDELPQLFNVLRGDMSLVGPRPALPSEVAQFDAQLLGRHTVRPGITGLWQVEARENPSFGPYRRLDLLYANSWSLSLDMVILVLTVQTVLTRTLVSLTNAVRNRIHPTTYSEVRLLD